MNNTNAAVEAAASDQIIIATKIRIEVWEERAEHTISTFECNDMAAVTQMLAHNNEGLYMVTNLAIGETRTYDSKEFREWCATQTLDTMVDYRIAFTVVWNKASLHGRGEITHEVSFTRVKRPDVLNEIAQPLCVPEATDAGPI